MENLNSLKNIIEAILFASGEPISLNVLSTSLDLKKNEIKEALTELQNDYDNRKSGLTILNMNNMVQMSTREDYSSLVENVLSPIRSQKLTKAAIEVLSIVAYRQPMTRTEIAQIRGVRSDYLILSLLKKGLIEECGHKDTLGNPVQFGTTHIFLRDFNLKDISHLPILDETNDLDDVSDFISDPEESIVENDISVSEEESA